jgi:hypothetical protein
MSKLYPFADFIGVEGIYSTYKEDNYRDHNRVKIYYSQPYYLIAAYRDTQLFNLTWNKQVFEKDKLIHLQKNAGKYSIENNRLVSGALLELEDFLGTSAYIRIMENIDKLFPIITSAYRLIGLKGIKDLGFNKSKIIRELHILDLAEKRNLFPIDLVYSTFFKGHSYSRAYIKKTFQQFYEDLGLDITALATDILKYFEVKYKNKPVGGKSKSSWILLEHKYCVSASYKRP